MLNRYYSLVKLMTAGSQHVVVVVGKVPTETKQVVVVVKYDVATSLIRNIIGIRRNAFF